MDRLESIGGDDLTERFGLLDSFFQTLGITFAVSGDERGRDRTWPMDLVPRIIPSTEWAHIESGLIQRVTTLNRFLDDLYFGEQAAIRDGVIPRWLVESSDGYVREAYGVPAPKGRVASLPASTSSATATGSTGCSRTTCAYRVGSHMCSRTVSP